ncbi:hypothetical protein LINGRAHAP2_LOCUS29629, partial [Linum grandiflorum]
LLFYLIFILSNLILSLIFSSLLSNLTQNLQTTTTGFQYMESENHRSCPSHPPKPLLVSIVTVLAAPHSPAGGNLRHCRTMETGSASPSRSMAEVEIELEGEQIQLDQRVEGEREGEEERNQTVL